MSDHETIDVYDRRAGDYAAKSKGWNTGDPHLGAFIAACPPGGRVLDLGCGPGDCAAVMARAGLRVEAIDASAEMVALAGVRDGVTAWQATFDGITADRAYDGVWANFSLLHAARADFPRHLAAIHRALRPGGAFFLALKRGTGEGRDAIGRFYTYYSGEELDRLLAAAGFSVCSRRSGSGPGLDGTVSDWMAVAARA